MQHHETQLDTTGVADMAQAVSVFLVCR